MRRLAGALALLVAVPAQAQRAGDNVLTSAADAFGASLGRENFGIYTANRVRGFSPTEAGNTRMMGLYFDQIGMTSRSIRLGSSVKVGLGVLESPFPAPTGVVDLALRVPNLEGARTGGGSVTLGITETWKGTLDFEKELPLSDSFGVTVGGVFEAHNIVNGDQGRNWGLGITARWRPVESLEIIPFFGGFTRYNELGRQRWFTRDRQQPVKQADRMTAIGPLWAGNTDTPMNGGVTLHITPGDGWDVQAGLFRSSMIRQLNHSILARDIDETGIGARDVIADPRNVRFSWSGEARLSRTLRTGALGHKLIGAVRGRRVFARVGGSSRVSLGRYDLAERVDVPRPEFSFGPQTIDKVRQNVLALGYEGRWGRLAEVAGGMQITDYRKRIDQPGQPLIVQEDKPLLFNGTIAINAARGVVMYGAFAQGLEETAPPPPEAANRNDLLPAQRTEQMEAGVRLKLPRKLTFNASAFRITKPLFALDDALVFRERGSVRHQGVEASLAGTPLPGLNVLVGLVGLDARNFGEDVLAGRLGLRPVGRAAISGRMALNWRPHGTSPFSFDLVVEGDGPMQATRDNLVQSVGGMDIDIGARYRFRLAGHDATFRLQMTEVTNSFRWEVAADGAWQTSNPRSIVAFVTMNI